MEDRCPENCGCLARIRNVEKVEDSLKEESDKMREKINDVTVCISKKFNHILIAIIINLVTLVGALCLAIAKLS